MQAGVRLLVEGGDAIALDRLRRVRVVSAGKAAAAMLNALLARLRLPSIVRAAGSADRGGATGESARDDSVFLRRTSRAE